MSQSGDAAEQIVKMSLDGAEVVLKLTGTGLKNIAAFLLAAAKSDGNNKMKLSGKERLKTMLKSGKELKVFGIKESDLEQFTKYAKRYGVVYCAIRDKDGSPDGLTDVMAKAEDAPKIDRIVERLNFAAVDRATIKSEIVKSKAEKQTAELDITEKDDADKLLDELLPSDEGKADPKQGAPADKEDYAQNPRTAKTEKSPPSEPSSENKSESAKGISEPKESVREFLRESAARKKEADAPKRDEPKRDDKSTLSKSNQHKQPQNRRKPTSKKSKER